MTLPALQRDLGRTAGLIEAANDYCYDDASVRITDMLIDLGYVAEHERQA